MKIGILTYHYSNNYGALLQTFALSTTLNRLGYETEIINRVPDVTLQETYNPNIKRFFNKTIQTHFRKSFSQFRKKYLPNITKQIKKNELKSFVKRYDAVIVGSDQVWRIEYTTGLGLNNFLDFVPDNIKKIAFAASFGKEKFDGDTPTIEKIKKLLSRFIAISVREESGVQICAELFNVKATHLLDPTLLLTLDDYLPIIKENEKNISGKYIAKYLLDETQQKLDIIASIAHEKSLKIRNATRESNINFRLRNLDFFSRKYYYPSFSTWLWTIKNAVFVITDSFHGVIFSIIFNKQFICIANNQRGLTRMTSLLMKLGLEDRLVFESDENAHQFIYDIINYEPINLKLNVERNRALDFLIHSINS